MWWVFGNISEGLAVETVEKARELLKLEPLEVENVLDVRTLALDAGTSFVVEVPLVDDENENSCSITSY